MSQHNDQPKSAAPWSSLQHVTSSAVFCTSNLLFSFYWSPPKLMKTYQFNSKITQLCTDILLCGWWMHTWFCFLKSTNIHCILDVSCRPSSDPESLICLGFVWLEGHLDLAPSNFKNNCLTQDQKVNHFYCGHILLMFEITNITNGCKQHSQSTSMRL